MRERGGGTMTPDELEGLEYHGVAGGSHDCQDAVMRLLQFGDPSCACVFLLMPITTACC